MKYSALLLLFTIVFNGCASQGFNDVEQEQIITFLNTKPKEIIITSQLAKPFRSWTLAGQGSTISEAIVRQKKKPWVALMNGQQFMRLCFEKDSSNFVLCPASFILLQYAFDFVKKIYFIDDTIPGDEKCFVVNALKLSNYLEKKSKPFQIACTRNDITKKQNKALRTKIQSLITSREFDAQGDIITQMSKKEKDVSVESSFLSKKSIALVGRLCMTAGAIIGFLYWAHLCLIYSEQCVDLFAQKA